MASLSKVAKATTTSNSLRATIPEKIIDELKIKQGDILVWSVEQRKDKKVMIVQRFEES